MSHWQLRNCCSDMYVNEVMSGQCDGKAIPTIIKETPATAYVDGHNALGTVSLLVENVINFRTYSLHTLHMHDCQKQ